MNEKDPCDNCDKRDCALHTWPVCAKKIEYDDKTGKLHVINEYVNHKPYCAKMQNHTGEVPCTCHLDELLASLSEPIEATCLCMDCGIIIKVSEQGKHISECPKSHLAKPVCKTCGGSGKVYLGHNKDGTNVEIGNCPDCQSESEKEEISPIVLEMIADENTTLNPFERRALKAIANTVSNKDLEISRLKEIATLYAKILHNDGRLSTMKAAQDLELGYKEVSEWHEKSMAKLESDIASLNGIIEKARKERVLSNSVVMCPDEDCCGCLGEPQIVGDLVCNECGKHYEILGKGK